MFVITLPGFDELLIMSLSIELLLSGVSFELVIIVSSYLKLFPSYVKIKGRMIISYIML